MYLCKSSVLFTFALLIFNLLIMVVENYQISNIYDCTTDTKFGRNVMLNNITSDLVTVEVMPSSMKEYVTTVLSPGWNPIVVKAIRNVTPNTIQYGW